MAITSYSVARIGRVTIVTVTSDLSGDVRYHWYADGSWIGETTEPSLARALGAGSQEEILAIDTTDADFDPVANAPEGWPARRTLWWTSSEDSDVEGYHVEMRVDSGDWSRIAYVADGGAWSHQYITPRMADLAEYAFRVISVDAAGNDGTALALAAERAVRLPDAPEYEIAFTPATLRVTYSEVAA